MKPRIYLYKITFKGRPEWYWGIHKEKKFDEYYMGSPCTHKEFWSLFNPSKEILETFDYSEKGWKEANLREQALILPHLNDPLCLNENCGSVPSLAVRSNTMRKLNAIWRSDQSYREAMSNHRKLKWQDSEYKNFMLKRALESLEEKKRDPLFREKVSQKIKLKWQDPEFRRYMESINSSHKFSDSQIKERFDLVLSSNIDLTKYGWVKKVSDLWGVSHTQVKRIFKDHWEGDPPYERKSARTSAL